LRKSGMSSSSSSYSGLRGCRCGAGGWAAGELDGPCDGQLCVGDWDGAGLWGAGGWFDGWCAVRTGSPCCGRAEWVVPAPGRPSPVFGTGTVSSVAGVPWPA
jgi:hypothetical protein